MMIQRIFHGLVLLGVVWLFISGLIQAKVHIAENDSILKNQVFRQTEPLKKKVLDGGEVSY